jgi:5-methyltetrahydropteroyltriglutamate--homocysteine methyltransferase
MLRTRPPFRADQVGSLLRPQALKEARQRRERGEITAHELRTVEDREIVALIGKQQEVGLQGVTDGEFRRTYWHFDFLEGLEGIEGFQSDHGIAFQGGVESPAKGLRVTGRIDFSSQHPMLEHFRFLRAHAGAVPKMTIPSPSVLHFRGGRAAVSPEVYPDMDYFFHDLGEAYRKAVRAFADAGCRYLQLDEVNFAYLCDPEQRAMLKARGDEPEKLPRIYADLINCAISDRPADMTISTHLCRGNYRSSWIAQGGYEPVAEVLFDQLGVDAYFLEYDTDRAGGFEPLRMLPKGKFVVLGLVTSKSGALEGKDEIKRRIDEATKHASLDQLCLSPQCGFASTEEGNNLTEQDQWAKLSRVVEVAEEVWGLDASPAPLNGVSTKVPVTPN